MTILGLLAGLLAYEKNLCPQSQRLSVKNHRIFMGFASEEPTAAQLLSSHYLARWSIANGV